MKEPIAEKIANAKPSTWLTDGLTKEEIQEARETALVEANNAKWQKAIEAIKEEINTIADLSAKTNDRTLFGGLELSLGIIDKHTKELMK